MRAALYPVAAFVAAWPLTLVEHAALTLRELNQKHMPDLTHLGLPQMHITVPHLALAAAAVVVMRFWLWKFRVR